MAKKTGRTPHGWTDTIGKELDKAGDRTAARDREAKHRYAMNFSTALARKVADALRADFPEILPSLDGSGTESQARTGKGYKKLDVNYSTPALGLGLGISIKTLNFRDAKTKRYTKNVTRIDNELRAEAHDYHERQPYCVLAALVFIPVDACDDGVKQDPESSFAAIVRNLRLRGRRKSSKDEPATFELIFIGLYAPDGNNRGSVGFFDVETAPPKTGKPGRLLTFSATLGEIRNTFDERNEVNFQYERGVEKKIETLVDDESVTQDP